MKILKIILNVVAWLGIIWSIIGIRYIAETTILDITYTPDQIRIALPTSGWFHFTAGMIFGSIGGIVERPRYIWSVMIILGTVCCILTVIGSIAQWYHFHYPFISTTSGLFLKLLLGIWYIIAGFLIRWQRVRMSIKQASPGS